MSQDEARQLTNILLDDIHADAEFNSRGTIAPIDVVDLAKDIDINGLLQPVVVRPYNEVEQAETGKKYLLIMGYRRHMSFHVLGRETIPAIIREDIHDELKARVLNLSENLKRKDLTLWQEAKALSALHDLGLTEQSVSEEIGMSRGWVQVRFMVLRLPQAVQDEVKAGLIIQADIRDLYTVFRNNGKDDCFEAVRKLKEAKASGRKINIKKGKPMSKRVRSRPEMFEMQEHLVKTFKKNTVATRVLAWSAGEISTYEFYITVRLYCEEHNIPYVIPQGAEDNNEYI